jgi:ATP-binding cassette, subfamily A (ABC1), member 3
VSAPNQSQAQDKSGSVSQTESPAIVVSHLAKSFRTSLLPSFRSSRGKSGEADTDSVTAIADLSFVVPRGGIFVLLGSNGAGKSTALGVLAGLIGRSGGSVTFPRASGGDNTEKDAAPGTEREWDGPSRPPKGVLGIVPQKNVLFPELTCFQTMQLWSAVKRPVDRGQAERSEAERQTCVHVEETPEELERLLVDCGLEGKVHSNAGSLSGGQKRKLQLAIGLVGGSESEFR